MPKTLHSSTYLVIAGRRTAENKIGEIFLIVWFTTAYPHSPSSRFDRSVEPQPDRSHTQDGRKGATHEEDSDCVFGPCLHHHHHRFTCFHLSAAALPLTAAPLLPTRRLCFCGTLNVKKSRWSDLVPKIKAHGERGEWRRCNEGFLCMWCWSGWDIGWAIPRNLKEKKHHRRFLSGVVVVVPCEEWGEGWTGSNHQ